MLPRLIIGRISSMVPELAAIVNPAKSSSNSSSKQESWTQRSMYLWLTTKYKGVKLKRLNEPNPLYISEDVQWAQVVLFVRWTRRSIQAS